MLTHEMVVVPAPAGGLKATKVGGTSHDSRALGEAKDPLVVPTKRA